MLLLVCFYYTPFLSTFVVVGVVDDDVVAVVLNVFVVVVVVIDDNVELLKFIFTTINSGPEHNCPISSLLPCNSTRS